MASKQTMVYIVVGVVAVATLILLMYGGLIQEDMPLKKTVANWRDSSKINKQPALAPYLDYTNAQTKVRDSFSQDAIKTSLKQKEAHYIPQDTEHVESELDKLVTEREVNNTIPASARPCPGYWELRGINFMHPALAERLCKNQIAYKMIDNKFPPCEISGHVPRKLLKRLNETAVRTFIWSAVTGRNVIIYTYPAGDFVSGSVISTHGWEGGQVSVTLSIAKKFPAGSVTFMDIGCNIGVYALQAREADIPTVAVDANIRNLLRIRISANDMGWTSDPKLKLMWMFFHKSVSLQYLNFGTGWCNVGGATSNKESMTDTIPVMTGLADDLFSTVKTELVVMKIDIETSEHIFFSTGERLFREKKIVAVQMEFWRPSGSSPSYTSPNFDKIVDFFGKRNYTLFPMGSWVTPLNLRTFRDWDAIWIKNEFLTTLRGGRP